MLQFPAYLTIQTTHLIASKLVFKMNYARVHSWLEDGDDGPQQSGYLAEKLIEAMRYFTAPEIKSDHARAFAFEAVVKEWLTLKDWEEITKSKRLKMLERVVFPRIGDMPIKTITSAHILEILKGTAQDNDPSVTAEAKRTISGVFELAISTLSASSDPARKALPANKIQHRRPLSADEIGQLLRDVQFHGGRHESEVDDALEMAEQTEV
ncbi:hypothetical protein D9M69_528230 [compost metagenome]